MVSFSSKSAENTREMARHIIRTSDDLTFAEGRFVGGLAYATREVTDKQLSWLRDLYTRHVVAVN